MVRVGSGFAKAPNHKSKIEPNRLKIEALLPVLQDARKRKLSAMSQQIFISFILFSVEAAVVHYTFGIKVFNNEVLHALMQVNDE